MRLRQMFYSHLTRKYLIALGIIAVLSCSAFAVTHDLIRSQKTSAAVINISGRQRMLSQKAVLLSWELVQAIDVTAQQRAKAQLAETADLLEKSHSGLINGDPEMKLPGNPSPQMQSIYFSEPVLLDQKVKNFVAELRELAKAPLPSNTDEHFQYILNEGKGNLLDSFDSAVRQYQRESEVETEKLDNAETLILGLTLFVLMLEGLFVFRPMIKKILFDRQEISAANERLFRLSSLDGLTEIPNRRTFDEFLNREWKRAFRNKTPICIVIADIDNFKAYNDTYGHQEGDICLKKIAMALKECCNRPDDLVARYGGEEFGVVLGDTGTDGASRVAERMRAKVESLKISHIGSKTSEFVTISLGVAVVIPDENLSPSILVKTADQALYQAKNEGRNRVKIINQLVMA